MVARDEGGKQRIETVVRPHEQALVHNTCRTKRLGARSNARDGLLVRQRS